MAVRTISYTVSDYALNPSSAQFGGMQNEHNATEVKYTIDDGFLAELKSKGYPLLFRIDFDSPGAGYQPSGDLDLTENNSVSREIPRLMTQYGGQMQSTLVISALNDGNEEFEVLSLPSVIRFVAVQKSDSDLAASLPAYQAHIEELVKDAMNKNAESKEILEGIKKDLNDGEFDGFSPIARVEQKTDGAEVTVTDRAGTTKAIIKNGATGPRGIQGPEGPQGKPGEVSLKYLHQNVANALKGSASGKEVILKDVSPLDHDIKVKLSGEGDFGGGLEKGELIGTVDEIWDESIMAHSWQNEGELGSFSVYQNYVPVDNRTDLYVNIPAFSGASAGLLVTDGTVYRTYRACGYEGGEVYCRIENGEIYISYNGKDIINYFIPEGMKIIGVSCNGENFANNELTLYACEIGSGVKLYKGGKNLVKPDYYSNSSNTGGMEITLNPDGSVTFNGTAKADKWFYFYSAEKVRKFPKGKYFLSGCPKGGSNSKYKLACSKGNDLGNGLAFELTTDTDLALNFFVAKDQTLNNVTIRPQIEMGSVGTEWEPYIEPTECVVNTDGTANVPSLYPTTRLYTDTDNVTIEAEYNRDINKVFAELTNALISLGGNV